MEYSYTEIAYKIVNFILNLKQGQTVTISAELHNVMESNEALVQIPFLEELAIIVRKNKGLPILDISTENLHKRFFEEITDDPPEIAVELLYKWLDCSDMFIDLGWRTNPLFYKSIPERSFSKLNIGNKDFKSLFEKKEKKLILLGFPTMGLAKYLEVDHAILKKTYFLALNVNYYDLKKRCIVLDAKLKKNAHWKLGSIDDQALTIEFTKSSTSYYGDMQNESIIMLPTGYWTQPLNLNALNGTYICENVYHEQFMWKSFKFVFEKGKITTLDTDMQQKNINLIKTILFDDIVSISLQVGLNHAVREKSGYHLFDGVKYKNVSLVINTIKGQVIALSETAKIYRDNEDNILDEV